MFPFAKVSSYWIFMKTRKITAYGRVFRAKALGCDEKALWTNEYQLIVRLLFSAIGQTVIDGVNHSMFDVMFCEGI